MDMPHSAPSHMLGMPENAGQIIGLPAAIAMIGLLLIVWLKRVRTVRLSRWFSSLLDPHHLLRRPLPQLTSPGLAFRAPDFP